MFVRVGREEVHSRGLQWARKTMLTKQHMLAALLDYDNDFRQWMQARVWIEIGWSHSLGP